MESSETKFRRNREIALAVLNGSTFKETAAEHGIHAVTARLVFLREIERYAPLSFAMIADSEKLMARHITNKPSLELIRRMKVEVLRELGGSAVPANRVELLESVIKDLLEQIEFCEGTAQIDVNPARKSIGLLPQ